MALEFQTYSIVAGTTYCNASCFFCVSKMTTDEDLKEELDARPPVHWRNFHKASGLAKMSGVTTVLITGKGEPTLYPREITAYLEALEPYRFPLVELQTNGIALSSRRYAGAEDHLGRWYELGLNTVILSIVHVDDELNRGIYTPSRRRYPPLAETVELLHRRGFTVRLGVVMVRGLIDSPEGIEQVVEFARKHGVEQLTFRPVTQAEQSRDLVTLHRTRDASVPEERLAAIRDHVESRGRLLLNLVHGAKVYDYAGQNLCLSNCLTLEPAEPELRSLIFLSNGQLIYDWQYSGAVILGGDRRSTDAAGR